MSNSDKAPRWLVRWLITAGLLVLLVGIGWEIHQELTFADRMDAYLHRLNCQFAKDVAMSETDVTKANLLATTARLICSGP